MSWLQGDGSYLRVTGPEGKVVYLPLAAPNGQKLCAPAYTATTGWRGTTDAHGTKYYYNETTGETSWTDPSAASGSGAPQGSTMDQAWQELKDELGNTYYFNSDTQETSWTLPASSGAEPAAAVCVQQFTVRERRAAVCVQWQRVGVSPLGLVPVGGVGAPWE